MALALLIVSVEGEVCWPRTIASGLLLIHSSVSKPGLKPPAYMDTAARRRAPDPTWIGRRGDERRTLHGYGGAATSAGPYVESKRQDPTRRDPTLCRAVSCRARLPIT